MASFFQELDMIYCLTLPERKEFVLNQIAQFNIQNKVKIWDAFTPDHQEIKNVISKQLIFPIYTDSSSNICNYLGMISIMRDIVQNKYNYAMIMEDDVIFLKEYINVGNKWINKQTLSQIFDVTKPYNLYLQSNNPENYYSNNINPNGQIIRGNIRYGEPVVILNHLFCSILLSYAFPITSPFDEYKYIVRKKFSVQQGILLPYICRELSGNYFSYNIKNLGFNFNRTLKIGKSVYNFDQFKNFYLDLGIDAYYKKLVKYLISIINPSLKIVFEMTDEMRSEIKPDAMVYSFGQKVTTLGNDYIAGGSIEKSISRKNGPTFIISVRGKKSNQILKSIYGMEFFIGDFLLLYGSFIKRSSIKKQVYCYIYDAKPKIDCDSTYCVIDSNDLDQMFEAINSSSYVITDNIHNIIISHSFGIPAVLANVTDIRYSADKLIIDDYYSNFAPNLIKPLNLDQIHITSKLINQFNQPTLPMDQVYIDKLLSTCPFVFVQHRALVQNELFAQLI